MRARKYEEVLYISITQVESCKDPTGSYVQQSAMEVATYAQVKKLHKRLGFRDNANTQAVRSNIAHLWFAAQ